MMSQPMSSDSCPPLIPADDLMCAYLDARLRTEWHFQHICNHSRLWGRQGGNRRFPYAEFVGPPLVQLRDFPEAAQRAHGDLPSARVAVQGLPASKRTAGTPVQIGNPWANHSRRRRRPSYRIDCGTYLCPYQSGIEAMGQAVDVEPNIITAVAMADGATAVVDPKRSLAGRTQMAKQILMG